MKITFSLPDALVNEIRDAVVYLQRKGDPATMSSLSGDALRDYLRKLRNTHRISSFPKRLQGPRMGRPIR